MSDPTNKSAMAENDHLTVPFCRVATVDKELFRTEIFYTGERILMNRPIHDMASSDSDARSQATVIERRREVQL